MTADRDPYAFAECLCHSSPTLCAYIASGSVTREQAIKEIGASIAAAWVGQAAQVEEAGKDAG